MPIQTGNYTPINLVAHGDPPMAIPVTIKSGVTYTAGQLLARKTSDGLYEAHDNDGSGGLEVCSGILAASVNTNTSNGGATPVHMYVPGKGGVLIKSKLIAKDADALAAGIADLKMVETPGRDLVSF